MVSISAAAIPKPTSAPASACSAVAPVPSAFDRSTDSAASTTQKACSTDVVFATSTASASPSPARAALRNRTERRLQCARSIAQPLGDRGLSRGARAHPVVPGSVGRVGDLHGGEREAAQREGRGEPVDDAGRRRPSAAPRPPSVRARRCARRAPRSSAASPIAVLDLVGDETCARASATPRPAAVERVVLGRRVGRGRPFGGGDALEQRAPGAGRR